jgi:4-diphosphocytidyl-2-C-methyl-D-erythritol kinase
LPYRVLAPAKVNLTLRVLGRRPDGYHELSSLFVPLSLADRLEVAPGGRGIRVRVPGRPELETPDNLCVRAAEAFAAETGIGGGVRIHLEKHIPMAAGLGGGSSDAAAVLRCLARAHGLRGGDPRLARAALRVGSDVPFFLRAVPAHVRGRGEVLGPAPALPELHFLVVKPPFGVSAGEAYRTLAILRGEGTFPPGRDRKLPPSFPDARAVARALANDLEAAVVRLHPELADLRRRLQRAGALGTLLSGSGSCIFGLFSDRASLREGARRLEFRPKEEVFVARALRRGPGVRETVTQSQQPGRFECPRDAEGLVCRGG